MQYPEPPRVSSKQDAKNDADGYSAYVVVVFATAEQQAAVQVVRDRAGAGSMVPAHVTVKGTLNKVPSLREVQSLVDKSVSDLSAFEVEFSTERFLRHPDGQTIAGRHVRLCPDLDKLHRRVISALDPVSSCLYAPEIRGEFPPHLTVDDNPEPERADEAWRLLENPDIGSGFETSAVSLVGYAGPLSDGKWEHISDHPFGESK